MIWQACTLAASLVKFKVRLRFFALPNHCRDPSCESSAVNNPALALGL